MASTKGFEASVRKLLKCNTKVDKGNDDLQVFAEDTTGTRQAFALSGRLLTWSSWIQRSLSAKSVTGSSW